MTEAPLISIIVPVYNVEDHVAACIESIRAQTFADFEVIVVDDGATDNSHGRALVAIDGDPRFLVLRQENAGLSAARNTGLDHAAGRFIAFVDSDDRIDPEYLSALHSALSENDTDWASCAIRSVLPDGSSHVHSSIHSSPDIDPTMSADPQRWPLQNWTEVIDHYPSAWNKLYRASLIDGLRFDVGTLYEDHAFYHQAARRTDAILHVPRPLYLQTRERPGQITGEDSDRVFDQFHVLERLAAVMTEEKPGQVPAFAAIASRLLFERAAVIREPDRRNRFLECARTLLDEHSLRYMPDWSTGIGPSLGLELAGRMPLSVIIPWDGGAGLSETLTALSEASNCGAEVLIVCDRIPLPKAESTARLIPHLHGVRVVSSDGIGEGCARNTGLVEARGEFVIFLDAGDIPAPWAMLQQVNAMLHFGADVGVMPFFLGFEQDAPWHSGFHHERGLPPAPTHPELLDMAPDLAFAIACHPSPKIFDRAFLLSHGLRFGESALSDWVMVHQAALCARRVLRLAAAGYAIGQTPKDRRVISRPVPPRDLALAIQQIKNTMPARARLPLPSGWQHLLLARALHQKVAHVPMSRAARLRFVLAAASVVSALPPMPPETQLDPQTGPRLARLLSAAGASRLHCIMRLLGR